MKCVLLEENLTSLLAKVAFLVKYKLVYVKEIKVIKSKNQDAHFHHNLDLLHSTHSDFSVEELDEKKYTESNSVLLMKSARSIDEYLNLSPLIIDRGSEIIDEERRFNIKKDIYLYSKSKNDQIFYVGTETTETCDLRSLHNYDILVQELKEIMSILLNSPKMENKPKSPFKFLDSYSQEDKTIFFGRDEEIEELYFRVFKSHILLLFGISGVGKTSLIKCGLANKFEGTDWFPVHIRRGENIYQSLIKELEKSAVTEIPDIENAPITDIIESIYLDYFKPIYLIFDQFEELFIFGKKAERTKFMAAVRQLSTSKLQCRFIFSIREEYLGKLTEFEDEIPDFLSNRIRIYPMTHHNAREVIEKSCRSNDISLEDGFAEAMLHELFPGETEIDLAWLQIFLDQIYQLAQREQKTEGTISFTKDLIRKIGSVKDILGSFLEYEISQLDNQELALDILKTFVSSKGTKQQVAEEEIIEDIRSKTRQVDSETVAELLRKFVSIRILREKDENGKYELRHDSLAAKINEKITLPEKELKEIRQFIKNSLDNYSKSRILLKNDDIEYLTPYLNKLLLSHEEKEFINKSRKIIGEKKRKRRNLIMGVTSSVFLCLAILAVWALLGKEQANKAARIARSNETASFSLLNLDKDPSLSFRLAEEAFQTYRSHLAMEALSLAYETASYDPFYNELTAHHADIYCMDYTRPWRANYAQDLSTARQGSGI